MESEIAFGVELPSKNACEQNPNGSERNPKSHLALSFPQETHPNRTRTDPNRIRNRIWRGASPKKRIRTESERIRTESEIAFCVELPSRSESELNPNGSEQNPKSHLAWSFPLKTNPKRIRTDPNRIRNRIGRGPSL